MGNNKKEVLDFFENHIIKYIVKDLEILNTIKADEKGSGACSIPQASSTFSALDLIGYLIDPQDLKAVDMRFSSLLKNEKYFPQLAHFKQMDTFFESFRDNVRTYLAHRYLMTKYGITKIDTDELFISDSGSEIFNVSFFTKISIKAINDIYRDISSDQFKINGYSNEKSLKKIKEKLDNLKSNEGKFNVTLTGILASTVTLQTTKSLSD